MEHNRKPVNPLENAEPMSAITLSAEVAVSAPAVPPLDREQQTVPTLNPSSEHDVKLVAAVLARSRQAKLGRRVLSWKLSQPAGLRPSERRLSYNS